MLFRPVRRIFPLLCLLLVLCSPFSARADIIPKEMKPIFLTTILENLGEYPQYVFIQLETLGRDIRNAKVLDGKGRIHKGYKFNHLEILAVPKELFASKVQAGEKPATVEELDVLNLLENPAIARTTQPIEAGQQLVPRTSEVAGKEIFYRILSVANGTVALEKTGEKIFTEQPNQYPVNLFLFAFASTFSVELVAFFMLLRLVFRYRTPGTLRALFSVVVAQTLTLPVLWFLIEHYNLMGSIVAIGAESLAVGVETLVYTWLAKLPWRMAFLISLTCNAASYIVGLML